MCVCVCVCVCVCACASGILSAPYLALEFPVTLFPVTLMLQHETEGVALCRQLASRYAAP
jgi:hypothetical protein